MPYVYGSVVLNVDVLASIDMHLRLKHRAYHIALTLAKGRPGARMLEDAMVVVQYLSSLRPARLALVLCTCRII